MEEKILLVKSMEIAAVCHEVGSDLAENPIDNCLLRMSDLLTGRYSKMEIGIPVAKATIGAP